MKLRTIPLLVFLASAWLVFPAPAATEKAASTKSAQAEEDADETAVSRKSSSTSKKGAGDESGEKKLSSGGKSSAAKAKGTAESAEEVTEGTSTAKSESGARKKTKSSAEPEDETGSAGKKAGAKKKLTEDEAPANLRKEDTSAHKSRSGGDEPTEMETTAKHKADVPEAVAPGTEEKTKPATPPAKPGGTGAPPAYIESSDLKNFTEQPEKVRTLIESALALAHQGLTYKFGSDDPSQGGMDCSGSIAYLLREQGFKDVPRDASGQYAWARKNGQFFAVVSKKEGGFEFADLKSGDLLFWSGTYVVNRDPPVTHSMIYLGEHKSRKQRVMWGSSDGRTYDGKSRYGVGVFDFHMPKTGGEGEGASAAGKSPDFLGYARVPGLRGEESKLTAHGESGTEATKAEVAEDEKSSAKGEIPDAEEKKNGENTAKKPVKSGSSSAKRKSSR